MSSRLYHWGWVNTLSDFVRWWNCLMIHFSEHVPIVRWHITYLYFFRRYTFSKAVGKACGSKKQMDLCYFMHWMSRLIVGCSVTCYILCSFFHWKPFSLLFHQEDYAFLPSQNAGVRLFFHNDSRTVCLINIRVCVFVGDSFVYLVRVTAFFNFYLKSNPFPF